MEGIQRIGDHIWVEWQGGEPLLVSSRVFVSREEKLRLGGVATKDLCEPGRMIEN